MHLTPYAFKTNSGYSTCEIFCTYLGYDVSKTKGLPYGPFSLSHLPAYLDRCFIMIKV